MTIQELVDRLRAFDGTREIVGFVEDRPVPVLRVVERFEVVLIEMAEESEGYGYGV